MSRDQANENYAAKRRAADNAWAAVRANRTDFDLDEVLRAAAVAADEALKEAYMLRTKYAPTI